MMSRFEIGDSVIVVKAMEGWAYWCPAMTGLVGREGEVFDFECEDGEEYPRVRFFDEDGSDWDDGSEYFFPEEALELRRSWFEPLSSVMSVTALMNEGAFGNV